MLLTDNELELAVLVPLRMDFGIGLCADADWEREILGAGVRYKLSTD